MQAETWRCVTRCLYLFLMSIGGLAPLLVAINASEPGLIVHAVPSSDGHEVWLEVNIIGGIGIPVSGVLCDSLCQNCRAMACAASVCGATLTCFPAETTVEGQMSVAVTLSPPQTLETGPLPFVRAFSQAGQPTPVVSPDHLLELTIFPDSLPADTYIFILATPALPGALPSAHRLIGRPYSLRASGALVGSDRPMSLRLAYDPVWLAGASPHNLNIFAWDPAGQTWLEEEGVLFAGQDYLSTPTRRFTTYTLLEIPAWRDTFADTSGLAWINRTTPTPAGRLILSDKALSGVAISTPITLPTTITGWDQIVFTATTSATTSLTVDVLNSDGSALLTDVASGTSLASLNPALYPALRLRANLASTAAGQTPVLAEWRLSWQAVGEGQKVYLPVVLK